MFRYLCLTLYVFFVNKLLNYVRCLVFDEGVRIRGEGPPGGGVRLGSITPEVRREIIQLSSSGLYFIILSEILEN